MSLVELKKLIIFSYVEVSVCFREEVVIRVRSYGSGIF